MVTGGELLIVRAVDYVSGSLAVHIEGSKDPSIVFINGGVRTMQEEAVPLVATL